MKRLHRYLARHLGIGLLCGVAMALLPVSAISGPLTVGPSNAASVWLAGQMVDGERFEVNSGGGTYPDQGLTIDAVFAFAATDEADAYAARATAWLAKPEILTGYLGDGVNEAYAGAHAKLLLAAQIRGVDPTSFSGVNLPDRLRALQAPSGRFSDRSTFGDFSNAFSQSMAVLALDRTPAGAPAAAVDFLAGSQCPDGGFPLNFGQATCTSDVDSTALAVQALLATEQAEAADRGVAWLIGVQRADGSFGGLAPRTSGPTDEPNSNSTGLAAQALTAAGKDTAASRAVDFVVSLQLTADNGGLAAGEAGAIAYNRSAFDAAVASGIQEPTRDQWRRTTAQAVLGLAKVSFGELGTNEPATPPAPPQDGGDLSGTVAWVAVPALLGLLLLGLGWALWRARRSGERPS
jgi:Prenyltransferase and squalene oxidase repeat